MSIWGQSHINPVDNNAVSHRKIPFNMQQLSADDQILVQMPLKSQKEKIGAEILYEISVDGNFTLVSEQLQDENLIVLESDDAPKFANQAVQTTFEAKGYQSNIRLEIK
jgi:UDP-N-acetyl-D-mannosaminuronate dehydrogenase